MTHAGDIPCTCVENHVPSVIDPEIHHIWPSYANGPDVAENRVNLCPTAHSAVHWLLRRYEKAGGLPPWEDRRRLNPYLRHLADIGWKDVVQARAAKNTT